MTNTTKTRSRVPLVLAPSNEAVRSVTDLLDLSDFLVVTGPAGRPVDLHVDDINEDETTLRAVEARVDAPPISFIDPSQTANYTVRDFNRDFARYRLLEAGTYTIQVVYQPEWSDEAFTRAAVGRVASNVITITVIDSAPEIVRKSSHPSRLIVTRRGDHAVATIVNQLDVAVWVNLNTVEGSAAPPFARFRWRVVRGDGSEPLREDAPAPPASEFKRALLKTVQPGESVELGKISLDEVRRSSSASDSDPPAIVAEYTNITGRAWQRLERAGWLGNAKAPAPFRTMLPRRILTAAQMSAPLVVNTGD